MYQEVKKKIIEILRKHGSFILKEGFYATVGICIKEYIANKEIPRKENKGEIEFEKELDKLTDQILELFEQELKEQLLYPNAVNILSSLKVIENPLIPEGELWISKKDSQKLK